MTEDQANDLRKLLDRYDHLLDRYDHLTTYIKYCEEIIAKLHKITFIVGTDGFVKEIQLYIDDQTAVVGQHYEYGQRFREAIFEHYKLELAKSKKELEELQL